MFEYTVNSSGFGAAYRPLSVTSVDKSPYMPGDPYDTRVLITLHYDGDEEFYTGQSVSIAHSVQLPSIYSDGTENTWTFTKEYTVVSVDSFAKTVSFVYDSVEHVDVSDFFIYDDEGDIWWCFVFGGQNGIGNSVYEIGSVQLDVSFPVDDDLNPHSFTGLFSYYTQNSVRCMQTDIITGGTDSVSEFVNSVFDWYYQEVEDVADIDDSQYVYYTQNNVPTPSYTSDSHIKVDYGDSIVYYDKGFSGPNMSLMTVTTETAIFSVDDNFVVQIPNIGASITVPISVICGGDPSKDEIVRERFVEKEVEKSINGIVDMEKDIYYPVKRDVDGQNVSFVDVKRIKFNLHFRQHRGENWLVDDDDTLWNGILKNTLDNSWSFYNNVSDNQQTANQFFSYNNKSNQSDLLSFLGFTNSDVRFRKKALSKSFLRLSFYDSMKPGAQNLLAYSTIFLDSGKLFNKMSANSYVGSQTHGAFTIINMNESTVPNADGIHRIGVNTEPDLSGNDTNKEDMRLSSQIVAEGRGVSDKSSEGFCLYLWRDSDEGMIPVDIYMKAEFHNAKYGRRIPMMAPYDEHHHGFKSFDDILLDWQVHVGTENTDNYGYGIRKFNDYSYIRFKHVYDINSCKHVYYLDDTFYGNGGGYDGDEMVINLYEAKVRF